MSLLSSALGAVETAIAIADTVDRDDTRRRLKANLLTARGDLVALAQLGELSPESRSECVRRHLSIVK